MGFRRLFLKLGDQVTHRRYPQWGLGEVVEERTAVTEGGMCFVRIMFADGQERAFINDLDDVSCCYYAGIRVNA
jgi:hypothetical protein